MFLKIITHPVFMNLNFHMPMVVDLSHPLIMLTGENGSGKSTLLHSLYYSLKGEDVENFSYKLLQKPDRLGDVFLFDAEQHNPRKQLEFFEESAPRILDRNVVTVGERVAEQGDAQGPRIGSGGVGGDG